MRERCPKNPVHRGKIAHLSLNYWLDLEEQGCSLVSCELAVFKPEA